MRHSLLLSAQLCVLLVHGVVAWSADPAIGPSRLGHRSALRRFARVCDEPAWPDARVPSVRPGKRGAGPTAAGLGGIRPGGSRPRGSGPRGSGPGGSGPGGSGPGGSGPVGRGSGGCGSEVRETVWIRLVKFVRRHDAFDDLSCAQWAVVCGASEYCARALATRAPTWRQLSGSEARGRSAALLAELEARVREDLRAARVPDERMACLIRVVLAAAG